MPPPPQYNYNYGQYFTFWDRVGGSHLDPDLHGGDKDAICPGDEVPIKAAGADNGTGGGGEPVEPEAVRKGSARRGRSASPRRRQPGRAAKQT